VIITGANQGGKSTFLRSIGLAQVMMQSGMFVPAESFSSNVCEGLFTHYKRDRSENCVRLVRNGAEIAELYVGQQNPPITRPIKELKGFQKVFLDPGASQKVSLELDQRSVAYFNTTIHQWDGLPGTYNVLVGASSQDIRLSDQFLVKSEFTFQP
jgi:Fibronectin type III-like domain/MutS domain V